VLTHAPLQLTRGDWHVALHTPRLHTCVEVHAVVQVPQWLGSVCVSTQTPLQRV